MNPWWLLLLWPIVAVLVGIAFGRVAKLGDADQGLPHDGLRGVE